MTRDSHGYLKKGEAMSDGVFEILAMVNIIFAFLFGYSTGKHYGRIEGENKYRREHEHNTKRD